MWLIVGQTEDAEAVWLAERLRELDLVPLELVTAGSLAYDAEWEHRVGSWGTRSKLRLGDGRTIDSAQVGALLNRLTWLGAPIAVSAEDREYAGAELHALVLSWLQGFGAAALNRPAPIGLCGPWRAECHWRWIARQAGLRVHPYPAPAENTPSQASPHRRSVLVVDGEAVAVARTDDDWPAPDTRLLADSLGLDVFEAAFEPAADGEWELATVNVLPSLFAAGDGAVEALAAALRRRAGGPR